MKSFLLRLLCFSLLTFVCLNLVGWVLIQTNNQGRAVENVRIYNCLNKAGMTWEDSEVFILGDSVTAQMYPPDKYNGRINSMAMVMPSTLAGQYFLMRKLCDNNNLSGKKIALILLPEVFGHEFDHDWTFHYVLKPFYNSEYRPWEDSVFSDRIEKKWVAWLSQLPMINCSNWKPPLSLKYLADYEPSDGISELNRHYLQKMLKLADRESVELKIYSGILRAGRRGEAMSSLKQDITSYGFELAFEDYFDSVVYLKDKLFYDGEHLKSNITLEDNILNL